MDASQNSGHDENSAGSRSTTINIENDAVPTSGQETVSPHRSRNFLSFLNDSRPQSSTANVNHTAAGPMRNIHDINPSFLHANNRHRWREVLQLASLRTLITRPGNFRYTRLSPRDVQATSNSDNLRLLFLRNDPDDDSDVSQSTPLSSGLRNNSTHDETIITNNNNLNTGVTSSIGNGTEMSNTATNSINTDIDPPPTINIEENAPAAQNVFDTQRNANHGHQHGAPDDMDDENNVVSDMVVSVLSHVLRYLPFVCILLAKFIHDHLLGIFDLIILQSIMYSVNKTLRAQVALFSQKSYSILVRELGLVALIVAYRLAVSISAPDPFGLLVPPPTPTEIIKIETPSDAITPTANHEDVADSQSYVFSSYIKQQEMPFKIIVDPRETEHTVAIKKTISLGVLIYFIAVNDLLLKLITILVKISVTMLPTRVIKHKPRARMYVLIEFISQFYRAIVPIRQWVMFLFESYTGFEMISGMLFSSFYMGAKMFEFVERGKSLKKALINFIRNMDYERKPTKEELEASGTICPICHDNFNTPVVLECSHIFCDDCVTTWFKREQTCPMCRAKVSEDPTWQDGATTFFYQLY